ncbi:MAG TPA: DinB family protein [Candidatus Tectomicrobia bacterium]
MLAEMEALWEQFERVHNEVFRWSDRLSDDQLNWAPPAKDTNSIGNLIGHILGVELFWVVNRIGGQPVNRDRAAEFSHRMTRAGLLQRRAEVEARVREALDNLTATDLNRVVVTQNGEAPAGKFLLYLMSHVSGHMGQVIMTRKLLDSQQ